MLLVNDIVYIKQSSQGILILFELRLKIINNKKQCALGVLSLDMYLALKTIMALFVVDG